MSIYLQVIWYFEMRSFLEHCRIKKKHPRIQYHTPLAKRNGSFKRKYRICHDCNGIWAVLRIPKHDIPLDFLKYLENHLTFFNGFFATCFNFSLSNMTKPGSLDLDPGLYGKPINSWCISYETECRDQMRYCPIHIPSWRSGFYKDFSFALSTYMSSLNHGWNIFNAWSGWSKLWRRWWTIIDNKTFSC